MATRKSNATPAAKAPEKPTKMIPAAVVVGDLRDKLKKIDAGLKAIDSVLALIDEGDDWAHALGFAGQAIRTQVQEVYDQLGRMMADDDGSVIGIEEGGAE